MGDSTSWIAIRGKTAEDIRGKLRLRVTQARGAPILGASLAGGWYLVMGRWDFVYRLSLQELSVGVELVSLFIEDHVMASSVSGWRDGARIWHVEHEAEKGPLHLAAEGAVPPDYESIRDKHVAMQQKSGGEKSDVDYMYNIPRELAKAVTGFDYSEDEGVEYENLERAKRWGIF